MSQFYPVPMAALAGLIVWLILGETTALPPWAIGWVAAGVAFVAMLAWLASSLPNGSQMVGRRGEVDE